MGGDSKEAADEAWVAEVGFAFEEFEPGPAFDDRGVVGEFQAGRGCTMFAGERPRVVARLRPEGVTSVSEWTTD